MSHARSEGTGSLGVSSGGKLFVAAVICSGIAAFVSSFIPFRSDDPLRFGAFLAMALATSVVRASLPAAISGLSLTFLFMLVGTLALSLSETVLLITMLGVSESFWRRGGALGAIDIAFRASIAATSAMSSYLVFHSWDFGGLPVDVPLRLVMATAIFFILATFPEALRVSLSSARSIPSAWRDTYAWTLPYYLMGAIFACSLGFLKIGLGWPTLVLAAPLIYVIYRHYRLQLHREQAHRSNVEQMVDLNLRTIESLAIAIQARDHHAQQRLNRMQIYALAIGREMRLEPEELNALHTAVLLHDIGKLAVPDHIALKTGKLNKEEREKLKLHPTVGGQILDRVRFPYPAAAIVRHQREKWNGSGYPDGLKGEDIPVCARILSVVYAFDELLTERQFKRALAPSDAMNHIEKEAGSSYDPTVVSILRRRYRELEELTAVARNPWGIRTEPAPFRALIAQAGHENQSVLELAQDMGISLNMDETLSTFAMHLKRLLVYESIVVYVSRDGVLRPEYVHGENFRTLSSMEVPFGQGLSGWVAQNRRAVLNGDPALETGYSQSISPMGSALSMPLEAEGAVVGVLTLYRSEHEAFTRDHFRVLQAITPKLALCIHNALRFRQAESSASTDYLTGLPNARSLFLQLDSELARCRRLALPLAVLVSDLDGFKQVNDRFGHLEGNKLLQQVGAALKEGCREYDTVARMGGDEFVLVLPGLSPDTVREMIPRLRQIVKQAGVTVLKEDVIGFSVGEAYFPVDGDNAEQLLAEADQRMYRHKTQQKMLKGATRGYDFDAAEPVSLHRSTPEN